MTQATGPTDRKAVVELLGILTYGELTAFERLATDARLAPTLGDRAALARMAAAEFHDHERLHAHLVAMGVDPAEAMAPFVPVLDAFHDSTRPSSWLEGLVKAYVGDGIATDFYREVAAFLDEPDRALVLDVLGDTGYEDFAVAAIRGAIEREPSVAGRLALWARRLVGEALSQAQRVAVDHDALTLLIVGGTGDLAELGRLFLRLTEAHTRRMEKLGLSS